MGNMKGVMLAIVVVVVAFGSAIYFKDHSLINPTNTQNTPTTTQTKTTTTPTETVNEVTPTKETAVPLPTEEDIIRTFFNLINEQRPSDAVSMMAPDAIPNDSQKQAWAVEFNAFSKAKVVSIESAMKEDWTDTQHEYKVILDVSMKPESANAVIPYYGFDNGTNYRWVIINKVGTTWKILGIGTGP